jgi:SAM-dependent methyltransferase
MTLASYSALNASTLGRLREFANLYQRHARDIPEQVRVLTERLSEVRHNLEEALGHPVSGLRMLEIGPGQRQRQQAYFTACGNDVLGVDLDVIPQTPAQYLEMLQKNGGVRTLKTIGRKVLGLDSAYQRELCKQLGAGRQLQLPVRQMDATRLNFEDDSFDVIYSFSAFEHFPNPEAALAEVARVLRPGGAAYIALHLYTSESGIHDPRIFSGNRAELPFWAHLRPQHAHLVEPNAYLNKLRHREWEELFARHFPHARLLRYEHDRSWQAAEVAKLRAQGELEEYSDEELLTVDLCALWVKPGASAELPVAKPSEPAFHTPVKAA